jgi:hypothetical protein
MLLKMDNTTVYTLSIPLLFSILFGYVHHFSRLYVSNTKMIIRQGDQIQFVLTRVIDLNKKIKMLEQKLEDLNESNLTEEKEHELEPELNELNELNEDPILPEEKEPSFEIIESEPIKTQKEKGWIRYLF